MAKSASTLLAYYTASLIRHYFPENGQRALCEAIGSGRLDGAVSADVAFVRSIGHRELDLISEIASSAGPVVVKIHSDPEPVLLGSLESGRIRMTFIHRDPRDMILSAMDHCLQTRGTEDASLQEFTSVRDSIASARGWAAMACGWVGSGLARVVLYTDLVSGPARELARLADYLGIPAEPDVVNGLIKEEIARRRRGWNRFNRGELIRYNREMSQEDQALCNRELGELITKLGYQLQAPPPCS